MPEVIPKDMKFEWEAREVLDGVAELINGKVGRLQKLLLRELEERASRGDAKGAVKLLVTWSDVLLSSPSFWKVVVSTLREEGGMEEDNVVDAISGAMPMST